MNKKQEQDKIELVEAFLADTDAAKDALQAYIEPRFDGLKDDPQGKAFLKEHKLANASLEEVVDFGMGEIGRVLDEMKGIAENVTQKVNSGSKLSAEKIQEIKATIQKFEALVEGYSKNIERVKPKLTDPSLSEKRVQEIKATIQKFEALVEGYSKNIERVKSKLEKNENE